LNETEKSSNILCCSVIYIESFISWSDNLTYIDYTLKCLKGNRKVRNYREDDTWYCLDDDQDDIWRNSIIFKPKYKFVRREAELAGLVVNWDFVHRLCRLIMQMEEYQLVKKRAYIRNLIYILAYGKENKIERLYPEWMTFEQCSTICDEWFYDQEINHDHRPWCDHGGLTYFIQPGVHHVFVEACHNRRKGTNFELFHFYRNIKLRSPQNFEISGVPVIDLRRECSHLHFILLPTETAFKHYVNMCVLRLLSDFKLGRSLLSFFSLPYSYLHLENDQVGEPLTIFDGGYPCRKDILAEWWDNCDEIMEKVKSLKIDSLKYEIIDDDDM
jgi:hypothetical protein